MKRKADFGARVIRGVAYARGVAGIIHGSRSFGGPFQANISMTNRCNVRCIHCFIYSPYHEGPSFFEMRKNEMAHQSSHTNHEVRLQQSDADSEKVHSLIESLLSLGTQDFLFSGNGEPFLHNNILDFVQRVKRLSMNPLIELINS